MGFRNDAFATFWGEAEPVNEMVTKGRISVSRKNKQTNEYIQDFSGFVSFIGTAAAKKALKLKEKDRIKLISVDVSTHYDKAKNVTYTNYKIYDFEMADAHGTAAPPKAAPAVDSGEIEAVEVDEPLPF